MFSTPSRFSILAIMGISPPSSSKSRRSSKTSAALRTNDWAIKSTPNSTPNLISAISIADSVGKTILAPGTLTPLRLSTRPPTTTRQWISGPCLSITVSSSKPSSSKIWSPNSTPSTNAGQVMLTPRSSPKRSVPYKVKNWPGWRWTGPWAKDPRRISGPCVSRMIGTNLPTAWPTARIRCKRALCSAWEPWEKLSLATSTPALISFSNISGASLAGPMVATILV